MKKNWENCRCCLKCYKTCTAISLHKCNCLINEATKHLSPNLKETCCGCKGRNPEIISNRNGKIDGHVCFCNCHLQPEVSKCCELCRPNSLEKRNGLDTCRITVCSCHYIKPQEETESNQEKYNFAPHQGYLPTDRESNKLDREGLKEEWVGRFIAESNRQWDKFGFNPRYEFEDFIRQELDQQLTSYQNGLREKIEKMANIKDKFGEHGSGEMYAYQEVLSLIDTME